MKTTIGIIVTLMLMPLMALATIRYVDGTNGDDRWTGDSLSSAKKTIQAAIDVAMTGDKILVADGTYGIFASSNKLITIESANGPSLAIVDGGRNYTSSNQLDLSESNPGVYWETNTVVKGFTVQCFANARGGTFIRCIFRDNNSSSVGCGALDGAVAYSCLFVNNVGMNGAVGDITVFKNCTMVGNRATSGYNGVTLNSVLENCIVYNNGNNERETWSYFFNRSRLANWNHRDFKTFVGDPGFVDAANGDYRLSATSPCIDAGDDRYGVGDCDLAGNARISNGTVDIGCYEFRNDTTWYVDDANGNDANTGHDWAHAKKTIQNAIDLSADADTIYVTNGVYGAIATANKAISIVACGLRKDVIIDGKNTERCATLGTERGEYATVLEGFTITSGRASYSPGAGVQCGTLKGCYIVGCTNTFGVWNSCGGGAAYSHAVGCVFENNWSTHGGGLDSGIADCCIIRSNHAEDDGGAVSGTTIVRNSLIVNNESSNWGGGGSGAACAHASTNINCTIVGNCARAGGGIVAAGCTLINCVLSGNQGTLVYDPDCSALINCFTADNPMFVDAANGDYRLAADSPCIDAGDNNYAAGDTDLDGNVRVVNGKVDIGCYESTESNPLLVGLVAWYKFDGNTKDLSGNGYDLVNHGAAIVNGRNGNINGAFYFDGNSSYLCGSNEVWLTENSGTIAGWFKVENSITRFYSENTYSCNYSAPYAYIPRCASSGCAGVGFALGNNGLMVYEHSGGYLPTPLVYQGNIGGGWNHICITYQNNGAETLYINGEFVKTGVASSRIKQIG